MAQIPGLNTQSQIKYTVPQKQGQGESAAIGAAGDLGIAQARYNNSLLEGGLQLAEQIAGLAFYHRDMKDSADIDRAKADFHATNTAFENDYISDTTAYRTPDDPPYTPPEVSDQAAQLLRKKATYEGLLEEAMNKNGKAGYIGYSEEIKYLDQRLEAAGYVYKPKIDKPGDAKYNYETANSKYLGMLEEYDSRWGLDGSDPEGGLSKRAREKIAPWIAEQKTRFGDFVYDKANEYGLKRISAEYDSMMDNDIVNGDIESLKERAEEGIQRGVITPQAAEKKLDMGSYVIAYNGAKDFALSMVGAFDPEDIKSASDAWFLDGNGADKALKFVDENTMFTDHNGELVTIKPQDVENLKSAINQKWNQTQLTHQRWRVDEAHKYVNDGLDLLYKGELTMEYLNDFRGDSFAGGPYGQGGGREYLRKLLSADKTALYMPNPAARSKMHMVMLDDRITDEMFLQIVKDNIGERGLAPNEAYDFTKWAIDERADVFKGVATGFDAPGIISGMFDNMMGKAEEDGNYREVAVLQSQQAEALSKFTERVVRVMRDNPNYYNTASGAAELANMPTVIGKYYLDEQFQKDMNKTKNAVYSPVDSLFDPLSLSAAENVAVFFQTPGSGVFRREYSEGLIGLEKVLGSNFARVSGEDVETYIKPDNTIELFKPGRGGDYNTKTGGVGDIIDPRYVRYNKESGAYGVSYTYKVEGKKFRQYVFDNGVNKFIPVSEGMGLPIVDLYAEDVTRFGPGLIERTGDVIDRVREGREAAGGYPGSRGQAERYLDQAEAAEARRKIADDLGSSGQIVPEPDPTTGVESGRMGGR